MNTNLLTKNKATNFILPGSSASRTASVSESNKTEADDFEGKVKTRLLSMWNNMKYGWTIKTKTNFSKESPVWLLGRCYHKKSDSLSDGERTEMGTDIASEGEVIAAESPDEDEGIEAFKLDFISRMWLTYRREFPVLDGSSYSSDCGWGCMLRSGQMLLAQALVMHLLGRNWRWNQQQLLQNYPDVHRAILRLFGDRPSHNSPFSIHNLVQLGTMQGKQPGDWYGPAFVAHLLRKAVHVAGRDNSQLSQLNVYVAQDCCIYKQDVVDECQNGDKWKSLVILVPVRLGAEKFNYLYAPCLTTLLSHENCIGIIGGRPKHSLYFVGYQDDKLIHLDPHYCQEMVDVDAREFPVHSFHCRSPRKMNLSKMDPSCCIGFYCRTSSDFFNFVTSVQPYLIPPSRHGLSIEYPMFVFSEGRSSEALPPPTPRLYPEIEVSYAECPNIDGHDECEEFEIL